MRVAQVTFGCRLNRAESLDEGARLEAMGHRLVDISDSPDVIIVKCCSVTAKAERDSLKAIGRLKREHPSAEIRPEGCIASAMPPMAGGDVGLPSSAPLPMKTARAYLKVQDGCAGRCTYCIVPSFRGKPESVPLDYAIGRVAAFYSAGYAEVVLTGCNLSTYMSQGAGLDELALSAARQGIRVRIGSVEPGAAVERLLEAMKRENGICRFLHLSLQSASDPVLRRMKRPYSIEVAEALCERARSIFGDGLMLGADVIAGFPGETEGDFEATHSFLKRWGFANVHAFPYSERPGTPAATMDGAVPAEVRRLRAKELSSLGQETKRSFAHGFAGREVEVAVEGSRDGLSFGWTSEYLWTEINGVFARRSLVRAVVTGLDGCVLKAAAVNRPEAGGV